MGDHRHGHDVAEVSHREATLEPFAITGWTTPRRIVRARLRREAAKRAGYGGLLVLVLAIAACGGRDLTRQEFIALAERSCAQSIPEVARLPDPQALDMARLVPFSEQAKQVAKTTKERLQRAKPTRETTVEYGKFVVHVSDVEKQLEDLREAASARNRQEIEQSLLTIHHRGEEARSVARHLELPACVSLADRVARKADVASSGGSTAPQSSSARSTAVAALSDDTE